MAMHSWIWMVTFLVLATQLPLFSQSTDALVCKQAIKSAEPDQPYGKYLIQACLTSFEKYYNGGVQMQGEGSCAVAAVLQ